MKKYIVLLLLVISLCSCIVGKLYNQTNKQLYYQDVNRSNKIIKQRSKHDRSSNKIKERKLYKYIPDEQYYYYTPRQVVYGYNPYYDYWRRPYWRHPYYGGYPYGYWPSFGMGFGYGGRRGSYTFGFAW